MTPGGRLCVVVPTLDEGRALPRLLARLAHGSGGSGGSGADAADEVVVVDGGSRDDTAELARAAGARVLVTERGRGRQLAAGAAATDAELLLFLHADTVPAPGALAALRAAFGDPALGAAGMRQRIEDPGFLFRWIEGAANARVRGLGLVYGDSGLAVRREVYRAAGGFADLPLFEDVDLSRRLARVGRPRLVPDACLLVSARRWRREGVLRRTARNWMLTVGYLLGVDPRRLARHYPVHEVPAAPSPPEGETDAGGATREPAGS